MKGAISPSFGTQKGINLRQYIDVRNRRKLAEIGALVALGAGVWLVLAGFYSPLRFQGVSCEPGQLSAVWSEAENAFIAPITLVNGTLGDQKVAVTGGCSCGVLGVPDRLSPLSKKTSDILLYLHPASAGTTTLLRITPSGAPAIDIPVSLYSASR